jgi:hypothetical protein
MNAVAAIPTASKMAKLCIGLAVLSFSAGGLAVWTFQDIRYGAQLAAKDAFIANLEKTIAEEKSAVLERVSQRGAALDRKYSEQFGALQRAIQNAKVSISTDNQPRLLTPDELCILEQAERIAKGAELSGSCGKASIALSSSK